LKKNETVSRKIFVVCNYVFLLSLAFICLCPIINVLAISFSDQAYVSAGLVKLLPKGFNTKSYEFVISNAEYLRSMLVTIKRVVLGVSTNLILTTLIAYPLSKEVREFKRRTFYAWMFMITMIFSGGLIPTYMVVNQFGLIDKIWALILPGAVPIFSVVLMLNFFRGLPKELEDAAFIDGAGYIIALFRIYVPISAPSIATIALFATVNHWNAWFDGLIYMNKPQNYPLQSYLQTVIIERNLEMMSSLEIANIEEISDRTQKAAQIFIGTLPILLVYPFMQRYFTKGIVLGSVKG